MTQDKNIYQRIQQARVDLQESGLKKSGLNKHTNVSYFELGDFLPKVNEILNQQDLMTQFGMDKKRAWIHFFHQDKKLTFSIDRINAVLPKATEIQSHGATITYLRRYLMMIALEIAENDLVDSQNMIVLEKSEIDKIMDCKTVEELKEYCGSLKKSKGVSHQKMILKFYNERKAQLEKKGKHDK